MDRLSGEWTIALVVALGVVVALLLRWLERSSRRRRLRAQGVRARKGEERARELLEREGWFVEAAQARGRYDLRVDGAPVPVDLRVDFLVTRASSRYAVEVKTGREAVRPESTATRRQLLEYRMAYDVDGVLLVDAEAERVSLIEFPLTRLARASGRPSAWWSAPLAVALLAIVAVAAHDAGARSAQEHAPACR